MVHSKEGGWGRLMVCCSQWSASSLLRLWVFAALFTYGDLPKNHDLWAAVNLRFCESELLRSFRSMEESKVKSPDRRRLIGDFLMFVARSATNY
jgi:hypothetical protein